MSNVSTPPKVHLCALPTVLHPLPRLSEVLGIDLWIKRDDLTGFAGGGNKGRKLEYLLPQILASGADTVVSCGSTQSNFIRQLAGACATHNLRCIAAHMDLPFEPLPSHCSGGGGEGGQISTSQAYDSPSLSAQAQPSTQGGGKGEVLTDNSAETGNLHYDPYFPVERHIFPDGTWDELNDHRDALAEQERAKGHKVFVVNLGGGSPEGVYGFYQAGLELLQQNDNIDQVIVASSSGSTQVGLAHAFQNTSIKLIGIACDPEPEMPQDLSALSQDFIEKFPVNTPLKPGDFEFRLDWVGPGYGIPSDSGNAAINLMARKEGILLDRVYSGKALAGLIDLAKSGSLPGRTVFWHTGGAPSLLGT